MAEKKEELLQLINDHVDNANGRLEEIASIADRILTELRRTNDLLERIAEAK